MTAVRLDIRVVPPADITQFIIKIGRGSRERFVEHLIDFGFPLASALKRGARVASGTEFMGYRDADITLRAPIEPPSPLPIKKEWGDVLCELPDIPVYSRLVQIRRMMGEKSDARAVERLAYWFYCAAQIYSIEYRLFIMDTTRGRYDPYLYKPLWKLRGEFGY